MIDTNEAEKRRAQDDKHCHVPSQAVPVDPGLPPWMLIGTVLHVVGASTAANNTNTAEFDNKKAIPNVPAIRLAHKTTQTVARTFRGEDMGDPTPVAKFLAKRCILLGIEFQYWQVVVVAVFALVLAWAQRFGR